MVKAVYRSKEHRRRAVVVDLGGTQPGECLQRGLIVCDDEKPAASVHRWTGGR